METTATKDRLCCAMALMNSTNVLKTREQIYLNEMLNDWPKKVQVGKDQEKAQSEKDSHSKNRGGKKPNQQSGTHTMKHIVSRMSSYFPNRWPLSYLNLTKNMKTYIRRQQCWLKKKCWLTQCKQIINQYWLIFVI